MKNTAFRAWLMNKWMEYKSEYLAFEGHPCTTSPAIYFNRYKWFLRAQYRKEMSK